MKTILGLVIILALTLGGCFANVENHINKNGSIVGATKSNYIIINTTGNSILDIYKLEDAYVSENINTDGLNFKHPITGEHITIQGDVKVIRNPSKELWDLYKEYHGDIEFCKEK